MSSPPGLLASLWLTLTLAAIAPTAATAGAAQLALALLFWGALFAAGLTFSRRSGAATQSIVNVIAVLGIAVFVLQLLGGTGVLRAALMLLLWMQAARNFSLAQRRDVYFALAISFVLIVYGAAEARATPFALLLAAYSAAALATLMYCHQWQPAHTLSPAAPQVLPRTHLLTLCAAVLATGALCYLLLPRPPALGYGLVPLQGGSRYSDARWEQEARSGRAPTDRAEPEPSPDEPPPQRRDAQRGDSRSTGGTLDITRSRSGQDGNGEGANGIVLYINSDRMLYLRTTAFDRFDGLRWQTTDLRTIKQLPERGAFVLDPPRAAELRDAVNYQVHAVARIGADVPLAAHALELRAPTAVIAVRSDATVQLPVRIEPGFRYTARAATAASTVRPVLFDNGARRDIYLQLPPEFDPRIAELARTVAASAVTDLARAEVIEAHLRTKYAYSFDTVFTSQGLTPVAAFLFETRRGHCEFFASALAVMLRTQGIAARVVNGYLAHNYNPVTGFYEVRAFDGHAWVEAWIEPLGWVTFEPTPAYPAPQAARPTQEVLQQLRDYAEQLARQSELAGQPSLAQSTASVLQAATELWHLTLFVLSNAAAALLSWLNRHALGIAAALAAAAVCLWLGHRLRAQLVWIAGRAALRGASSQSVPIVAFRWLERLARTRALGRHPHESAAEYLRRLALRWGERRTDLRALGELFDRVRYDGQQLPPGDVQAARDAFFAIGPRIVADDGEARSEAKLRPVGSAR